MYVFGSWVSYSGHRRLALSFSLDRNDIEIATHSESVVKEKSQKRMFWFQIFSQINENSKNQYFFDVADKGLEMKWFISSKNFHFSKKRQVN